jgi:XapX domain-containing protein
MRPYLIALAAGLLVGVIYALLRVRSPAPPLVALVGLLGILIGEQIPAALHIVGASDAPPPLHSPVDSANSKSQEQP